VYVCVCVCARCVVVYTSVVYSRDNIGLHL